MIIAGLDTASQYSDTQMQMRLYVSTKPHGLIIHNTTVPLSFTSSSVNNLLYMLLILCPQPSLPTTSISIAVDTHSHTHKPLSVLARYLYDLVVGRHRIPSTVPLDLADSAGSVHEVTGPESSVKAIRGAESRAPDLGIVDLLDPASPSAVTDRQTDKQ
jgi:hypothetical protein